MSPTRQRDAEATRQAILEAAEGVFVEHGYADASVSQIARAAGVTKSLIHHHFGSKEGLWSEVKHHRFAEYAQAQKRILDQPRFDAGLLRDSVEAYFRFLQKHPDFVRLIGWMHLEEADSEFEPGEKLTMVGLEKIRAAQEAGDLRSDIHPFFILTSFLGLAQHWFQCKEHHCQWLQEEAGAVMDDDRYLEAMQKIFFEGVLPRDASPRATTSDSTTAEATEATLDPAASPS